MQVNHYFINDQKCKKQSQELKIEVVISDNDTNAFGDLNIIFYGEDEKEVVKNKNILIDNLIETLNKIKEEI